MKFVVTKKAAKTNFFRPSLLILFSDPGSGMYKKQEPQHWKNLFLFISRFLCNLGAEGGNGLVTSLPVQLVDPSAQQALHVSAE